MKKILLLLLFPIYSNAANIVEIQGDNSSLPGSPKSQMYVNSNHEAMVSASQSGSWIIKSTTAISGLQTPYNIALSSLTWTNLTPSPLSNRIGVYISNYIANTMTASIVLTTFTASNIGISTNTATMQLSNGDSAYFSLPTNLYIWGNSIGANDNLGITEIR